MLEAQEQAATARARHLSTFLTVLKFYLGLIVLLIVSALTSPHAANGNNIFLSSANISDMFRQIANVGVISIGMTFVIVTAGIDLSVGAIMGLGSVLTAMLLTTDGSNRAVYASLVLNAIAVFAIVLALLNVVRGFMRTRDAQSNHATHASRTPLAIDADIALAAAAFACAYIALHGAHRMLLLAVLWIVPFAGLTRGVLTAGSSRAGTCSLSS